MVQDHIWKNTFLTNFSPIFAPKTAPFQGMLVFPWPLNASPWAPIGLINTCLSIPNGPGSLLEKRVFDPFVTLFWSQNGPFLRHVGIFHGPKRVPMGSKWAKNTCLSIPNDPGSLLEKRVFDPFLTHFLSQNSLFSRHFGLFHGPKRVISGSKWAKKHLFEHPIWSRIAFGKMRL